jgi:hypothetical protein
MLLPDLLPGRSATIGLSLLSEGEIDQLTDIERPGDMRRLVNLVAASTASLAVRASMASGLQVPASTSSVTRTYSTCSSPSHLPLGPATWSPGRVATLKLFLNDCGLAGHLTGMSLRTLAIRLRRSGRLSRPAAPRLADLNSLDKRS